MRGCHDAEKHTLCRYYFTEVKFIPILAQHGALVLTGHTCIPKNGIAF